MTKTDALERSLAWLKRMEGCGEDFIWRGAAPTRSIIEAQAKEIERLTEALKQIAETPNAGWMIARAALKTVGSMG